MGNRELETNQPSRSYRFDLRIGDWGVHLRNDYVEIYRPHRQDLAHLSLFFATRQGGLDFHLSFDHDAVMQGFAQQKARVPLLHVSLNDLNRAGASINIAIEDAMRAWVAREFRRFHPDWLRRNSYVIAFTPRARGVDLLEELAPWRRGKYRLNPSWKEVVSREGAEVEVFEPSVLTELERTGLRMGLMSNSEYFVTAAKVEGGTHDQISLSCA